MTVHTSLVLAVVLVAVPGLGITAGATEPILTRQDLAPFDDEVNGVVAGPAADIVGRIRADDARACVTRRLSVLPPVLVVPVE